MLINEDFFRHFEYHPYVRQQCERMELGIPHWAKSPLTIQKEFFYEYNLGYGSEDSFTVQRMLDIAGLRYITRQSDKSQDQAFNVALITMHLMKKGHKFINPMAPPASLLDSTVRLFRLTTNRCRCHNKFITIL